jgi:hypothetical protein
MIYFSRSTPWHATSVFGVFHGLCKDLWYGAVWHVYKGVSTGVYGW